MDKQAKAILALSVGLISFFTSLGQFLLSHKEWATVITPEGVGHLCFMLAAFLTAFLGALHYQMPRDSRDYHEDRASDSLSQKSLYNRTRLELNDKEK